MQVSSIAELDTHAVIGGGQARVFTMSQTAEFFTVLSDTLYRDKKRAVVREVVCNAQDAHIMVGQIDRPVEITLTDEELVITDRGPGIPDDKMEAIYCDYGASTKTKDKNQTGGFGLGCKAPFAYSDHFTVVNRHAGFRYVYAISRGGIESDGLPMIRTMVKVPCGAETGLTVSIPLRKAEDRTQFEQLIQIIVQQGGIAATLNDVALPRFDFTEARKHGFALISRQNYRFRESSAYVLYGSVLYPVQTSDKDVMAKVQALDGMTEPGVSVLLIAQPDTIGVQPSREGLSFSELTNNTMHALIDNAIKEIRKRSAHHARALLTEHVASMARYEIRESNPSVAVASFADMLSNPDEIARRAVQRNLSVYLDGRQRRTLHMKVLARTHRDSRRIFRRGAADRDFSFHMERFEHQRRLGLRLAAKTGLLNNLLLPVYEDYGGRFTFFKIDEDRGDFNEIAPELIVAHSRKAVIEELRKRNTARKERNSNRDHSESKEEWRSCFCIIVPRIAEEKLVEIKTLGERYKLGVTVLPFPVRQVRKAAARDAFVGLNDLVVAHGNWTFNKASCTEPKFYLKVAGSEANLQLPWHTGAVEEIRAAETLFPGTVIVRTAKEIAKLQKLKVQLLTDALLAEMRALGRSREVLYALMVKQGEFVRHEGQHVDYWAPANRILRVMQQGVDYARIFFPDRFKSTGKAERLDGLLKIADRLKWTHREFSDAISKERTAAMKQAKEIFKDKIASLKQLDNDYPFMRMIDPNNTDKVSADDLGDFVRFMQRRKKINQY